MTVTARAVQDVLQANGLVRHVMYEYTDSVTGRVWYRNHRLPAGADINADLRRREAEMEQALVEQELDDVIERVKGGLIMERIRSGQNPTAITTKHATPEQVRQRIFQWWQTADPLEARLLVPAINALTDTDLMGMLGIDQATVDAIRARAARLDQVNALVEQG